MKSNLIIYLCLLGFFFQNAAKNGVVYAISAYLIITVLIVAGHFFQEFVRKHSGRD